MANKHVLSKIVPCDQNEEYFYNALIKTKTSDARGLAHSLVNESTAYAEAFVLAKSAVSWIEELEYNYSRFESKASKVAIISEEQFLSYCANKKWSVKKGTWDIIARDKSKFKAKFELETGVLYMIFNKEEKLEHIQLLNELEV